MNDGNTGTPGSTPNEDSAPARRRDDSVTTPQPNRRRGRPRGSSSASRSRSSSQPRRNQPRREDRSLSSGSERAPSIRESGAHGHQGHNIQSSQDSERSRYNVKYFRNRLRGMSAELSQATTPSQDGGIADLGNTFQQDPPDSPLAHPAPHPPIQEPMNEDPVEPPDDSQVQRICFCDQPKWSIECDHCLPEMPCGNHEAIACVRPDCDRLFH